MSEIKTIFRPVHVTASQELEDFITQRIQKFGKLSNNIIESEVFLKKINGAVENKEVEIRLVIPGNDLFASKTANTFEAATDLTIEALRRQLKKRKEKVWGV